MDSLLLNLGLIGAVIGCFLFVFLVSSGEGKRNVELMLIILLSVHNMIDSYLYYEVQLDQWFVGTSYYHYHLIGPFFAHFIFRISSNDTKKKWTVYLIVAITGIRFLLGAIYYEFEGQPDSYTADTVYLVDYYLSLFVNIGGLIVSYFEIKSLRFAITLSPLQQSRINWLKYLVIVSMITYIAIFQSSLISFFDETNFLFYLKMETGITSIVLFAMVLIALRFPVFNIHGDYTTISEGKEQNKYQNSSLNDTMAKALIKEVDDYLLTNQAYRKHGYKLNDLSHELGYSLHHISQAINEIKGCSFSTYLNLMRLEDAKRLLADLDHNYSVIGVAQTVGFSSKTSFYNFFKKTTGQTPTEYLRSLD